MRLGHVAIAVSDLDRMLGFYTDMLGLRVSDMGTGAGRPGMPRIGFLSSDPPKLHHQLAYAEHRPEQRPDGDANHRFERGLCVVKAGTHLEQRFHTFLQKTKAETGCACEIVGRASAGSTWSVLLREENGDRSVEVILDTEGRVRVVGDSWKDPAKVKELLPWTAHPAVHKARRSTRSCCWSAAGRSRYTSTSGPSASR